jgi:hypothetical protein
MKTFPLIIIALFLAVAGQTQPAFQQRLQPVLPPGAPPSQAERAAAMIDKQSVNYLIRVEWTQEKGDPQFLEVLTAEGSFELDTLQKNSVKINNNDIPVTLKLDGTLTAISDEKGRLQLFLGRTVPYVTGTYGSGPNAGSSYAQMSVGLQSTFIVTFGKPQVIQNDENGQITVLVKRKED